MPPKVNVSYNFKLLVFFTTYFVQFLQGTKLTVTRGFCVEKVQKKTLSGLNLSALSDLRKVAKSSSFFLIGTN